MNIKMKRFATVLGISAGLLATGIANAGIDFDNTKFYVGAEAGYTSFGKSKMIKGIEEERRIKLKKMPHLLLF